MFLAVTSCPGAHAGVARVHALGLSGACACPELVSRMLVSTSSGQGIGFGGLPSKSKSSSCLLDRAPACLPVAMSHTFT